MSNYFLFLDPASPMLRFRFSASECVLPPARSTTGLKLSLNAAKNDFFLAFLGINTPLGAGYHNIKVLTGVKLLSYAQYFTRGKNRDNVTKFLKEFGDVDAAAVLSKWKFLQYFKELDRDPTEAEKKAILSVLSNLGVDMEPLVKEIFPTLDLSICLAYADELKRTEGPYTCEQITDSCKFDCSVCSAEDSALMSPIEIKDDAHIASEKFGFYLPKNVDGMIMKTKKQDYRGLVKKFDQMHNYMTIAESTGTYVWNGKLWRDYLDLRIDEFADNMFDPKPLYRHVKEFKLIFKRTNIKSQSWFKNSEGYINLQNGVFSIKDNKIHKHDPKFAMRYVLPYEYDAEAKCPVFLKFLNDVTCGDDELQNILLEFMGYALAGGKPLAEKALILCGEGSNGKSTLLKTFKALVGEDCMSTLSLSALNNDQKRAAIEGKLFNYGEETSPNALAESEVFKTIVTGGDIDIKKVYQQPYSFQTNIKLIMACNELPRSNDRSFGLYRRLLIVPFNAEFSEKRGNIDKEIETKIFKELPGILNLCVSHYRTLVENNYNFTESKVVEETLDAYKAENDNVLRWIDECYDFSGDNDEYETSKGIYASYTDYSRTSGTKACSNIKFFKRLKKAVDVNRKQKRINGFQHWVYEGGRLK